MKLWDQTSRVNYKASRNTVSSLNRAAFGSISIHFQFIQPGTFGSVNGIQCDGARFMFPPDLRWKWTFCLIFFFFVLLNVNLSITLVNDQLDAQFFYFIILLLQPSTCFELPRAHHQGVRFYQYSIPSFSVSGRPLHRTANYREWRYQMVYW